MKFKFKKKVKKEVEDKSFFSYLKKFWKFMWYDDSAHSYVVTLIVAFFFIKFLFLPGVGFALGNDFPVVAIVSGSMEHKIVDHKICGVYKPSLKNKDLNFDDWWDICGYYYIENYELSKDDFSNFEFKNGLNTGDVMVIYGKKPENINVGEVLVFIPGDLNWYNSHGPVIHRVVDKWENDGEYFFRTKGDHNSVSSDANNFESAISGDDVIGVPVVRVPLIGYVRIWFSIFFLNPIMDIVR